MKRTIILIVSIVTHVAAMAFDKSSFRQQPVQMGFEENKGQVIDQYNNVRQDIQYTLQTPDLAVFIGNGALHYQFYKVEKLPGTQNLFGTAEIVKEKSILPGTRTVTYRVDVNLIGANINSAPSVTSILPGTNHYYTNIKQKNGATVHTCQKITYTDIYPGIDWVLYVQNNTLKYDFVVHPNANLTDIKLSYNGASDIALQNDGSLNVVTPFGTVTEQKPQTYQLSDHRPLASAFQLNKDQLSFTVKDNYQGTLVIDPGVVWATYYGGGNEYAGVKNSVACDPSGYVYMQGVTSSAHNIATVGSYIDTLDPGVAYSGGQDLYIVKFDSLGHRIWGTYFGGAGYYDTDLEATITTTATIACDNEYHIYIGGTTAVPVGISTTGSYQDTLTSGGLLYGFFPLSEDGYIVQFDSGGVRQWGTYFGGNNLEAVHGIICDVNNMVYIYGNTSSTNGIATSNSYQGSIGPCINCSSNNTIKTGAFIAQFNSSGAIQWGTYYGDGNQHSGGIWSAVSDVNGNIEIVGSLKPDATINDATYATAGTFEPASAGSYETYSDGYLAQLNANGTRNWGTFFHSTDPTASTDNSPNAITCDNANHIYIGGQTSAASGIATPGSFMENHSSDQYCGFLAQFNATNGLRNWATYYPDNIDGIICDHNAALYIAGVTLHSNNFPPFTNAFATPYSYQDSLIVDTLGGATNTANAFIGQFDSVGNRRWGTYFGGGNEKLDLYSNILACDNFGNLYLTGTTTIDTHIATSGSFQDTLGTIDTVGAGLSYAINDFLVRFAPVDIAISPNLVAPTNDTVCVNDATITVALQNKGHLSIDSMIVDGVYLYYDASTGVGDTSTTSATSNGPLVPGATTIVTLTNLNLHPGTDTVLIYLQHIIDDSSFVDDTLYAVVYAIAAPTVANINATNTDSLYSFSANNAQNVTGYQWSFGDGNTANGANVSHLYAASGNYTVTLVASNNCKSDTITTNVSAIGLGIANINNTSNISIYPNPTQQTLNIQIPAGLQTTELSIINTVGAKVYTEKVDVQNATKSLSVHGFNDGYYILKVNTNKGYYNVPFEILN